MTIFPLLYSRTAKGAVNTWQVRTEGPEVVCVWGQIDGKMQESRFTAEAKNTGKKNATTAEEQAVKEAEALVKKQLKKKYSESLDTAGETKRIKPMLAADYEKFRHKVKFPVTVQPKLDGCRCLAMKVNGKVVLQSRGGDYYELPHIQNYLVGLPDGMILDGELYVHGMSLQALNSLIRRPRKESEVLEYHIYDCASHPGPWHEREELIYSLALSFDAKIGRVASLAAENEEQVREIQKDFIESGYEGAIVRTSTGSYREGYRSPDLLKVKSWQDSEFRIIGFKVGKGKFEQCPVFRCITEDGQEFDVTPKGTEEERQEMLIEAETSIGKLLKVKYFQMSPYGVPLYPVGLGIRHPSDLS